MSKAFTRESDEDSAEEMFSPRPQASSEAQQYMTRAGADRLRQQLNALVERRRLLAGASHKANPDAKAALRRLDADIQKLEATLNSVITAERPADQEKVALGAFVRVRDEQGEEETYQIVGLGEADPKAGRISSVSPLARALLAKRAGDTVSFDSPLGSQELHILSVHY